MKGLAAVVRLELARSWLLLPVAAAVGFAPFGVVPFLDAPVRSAHGVASLLAVLLGAGTAILLGATTIAGDLSNGRLGFYFARPLAWWAIWAGKLATAFALTVVVWLLVRAPTALLAGEGESWPASWLLPGLAIALLLIGLSHWGAIAVRSRSPWIVLDLVAIPLVVWGVQNAIGVAADQGFFPTGGTMRLLLWAVVPTALAAGAAQVAIGRTSAARSHAVASLAGWAILGVVVLGLQVVVRTAFERTPQGLESAHVMSTAATGDTALFAGGERVLGFRSSFHHRFLTSPHGLVQVEPDPWTSFGFAFSGDGSRAVWLGWGEDGFGDLEVYRHDLAAGTTSSAALDRLGSWPTRWPRRVLADETGRRVAILHIGSTSVFDTSSGTRLARIEDDGRPVEYVTFREGRSDVVVRSTPEGGLAIETLDGSEVEPLGDLAAPAVGAFRTLHVDAAGERLYAGARGEARLVDLSTGETIASFAGNPAALLEGWLLSDGRVLTAGADLTATTLRHHDPTGTLLGELDLGAATSVHLLEASGGRVVASLSNPGQARSTPEGPAFLGERLAVVEMEPLRVLRVEDDLHWRPAQGPFLPARRDRPAGDRLLVTRVASLEPEVRSSLLRYDVESGRTEWVAGLR